MVAPFFALTQLPLLAWPGRASTSSAAAPPSLQHAQRHCQARYLINPRTASAFAEHNPWRFNEPFESNSFGTFNPSGRGPNRTAASASPAPSRPTLLNEFNFQLIPAAGVTLPITTPAAPLRTLAATVSITPNFTNGKGVPRQGADIQIDPFYSLNNSSPIPANWSGFVYAWSNNNDEDSRHHTLSSVSYRTIRPERRHSIDPASTPATVNQGGQFWELKTPG